MEPLFTKPEQNLPKQSISVDFISNNLNNNLKKLQGVHKQRNSIDLLTTNNFNNSDKKIQSVSLHRKSMNLDSINNNFSNETKLLTKPKKANDFISNVNINDNESMSSGYFSNYLSTESKSESNLLASGGGKLSRYNFICKNNAQEFYRKIILFLYLIDNLVCLSIC